MRHPSGFVGPAGDAMVLCSLADLHATSGTCGLCEMIMEALLRRWGSDPLSTADEFLEWAKKVPDLDAGPQIILYSYLFAEDRYGGAETSPPSNYQNEALIWHAFRLGVALRGPSDENRPYLDHAGDIQLLSTNPLTRGSTAAFQGRIINPDCANIQLAREWLDECEQSHGDLCEMASGGGDVAYARMAPQNLRVIDVHAMCLVLLPTKAKYVALSYCWAQSTRHFTMTTSNMASLQVPGGISSVWDELPGTIQDAIGCVLEMGREFLWIDALCIVQDDDMDKKEQISQMDRVYDNALLTIISAPAATQSFPPFDGLPGYRRKRQPSQATARLQGLKICTTLLSVEQATFTSAWNTRAWTFQENLLSRRRLFFSNAQLYFQCPCGVVCEDVAGEGKSPSAFIYPGTSLWNLSGLYNNISQGQQANHQGLSRSIFPNSSAAFDYYATVVEQYTGREMSNQGDALAALAGVISIFRATMKTEFIHGLPETFLDEALLWHQRGPHRRRTALSIASPGVGFPSWSWAGWNVLSNYRAQFSGWIRREVEWYLVHKDGTGFNLSRPALSEPPNPYNPSTSEDIGPKDSPPVTFLSTLRPREELTTQDLESCCLACWTSTAILQLLGDKLDLGDDSMDWKDHEAFIISSQRSQPVGTIFLEKSWDDIIKQNQHQGFEFMLLSRSSTVENMVSLDDVFPMKEWCFVNVMLIQRSADNAERLGVGVVHELAWISAAPEAALLYLR